jgi:spermidine synthase
VNAIAQPRVLIIRRLVLPLFLLSGATGLVYEVTWMRSLGTVFGNTVLAASTVLTAFMLGLALGSWLFGRWADRVRRPLRLYAGLELGIGLYAGAFPTILQLVDRFYLWFYQAADPGFYALNLVRFVTSVTILLLPTALMGGTLPILSGLWTIPEESRTVPRATGQSVGLLYALNTFGAVFGSFLAGYFLIRLWGVSWSMYATAAVNVFIGVAGLLLSSGVKPRRIFRKAAEPPPRAGEPTGGAARRAAGPRFVPTAGRRRAVLFAVFGAGFCALALEVLWTRVLVFVLETSAYAFTCMLTCFILGIALGSFLASSVLVPRLKNPIFGLGVVQLLQMVSVAASVLLLGYLWHIDLLVVERWIGPRVTFTRDMAVHFLDTLAVALVPTVLMGMVFPLAIQVCAPAWQTVGRRVGQVYAWDTVGCVLGSFVAGFLLIPWLGLRDSFLVVLGILALLGVFLIVLSGQRRRRWAVPAAVVAAVLLGAGALYLPRDVFLRTMNTYHYPSKIVYLDDGVTGTVTVHDLPDGDRLIAVDGVDVAGVDLMLRTTQKLQAYAPLLVHENPQDVVQIGYGSGETCGIGLAFGTARYTIVDICPGVFRAGPFFREINRGSYDNPRLRKVLMDGKNFIKLTREKFDVIMNDSTYPGTTGSSALYTYDHFRACRDHLKPGGVLSCWVPLDLRPQDFQIIVRSFQKAMPHSSLWMVNNCLNKHSVLLGTLGPTQLDLRRMAAVMGRGEVAEDLRGINIFSVYDFVNCLVVDEAGLRKLGGGGPLHTDDRPHLEFGATIKRDVNTCWRGVIDAIATFHSPLQPYVTNAVALPDQTDPPPTILQQYYLGTGYTLRGVVGMLQGDPEIMHPAFEMAKKANPRNRDVDSILAELDGEITALENEIRAGAQAVELRSRLAQKYLLLQRYEQAAQQYGAYLASRPDDASVWNNLGVCYKGLSQWEQAAEAFERALQRDARLLPAYANLAEVHEQQGDLPGAATVLRRLLPRLPRTGQANTYDALARLYFLQKQYDLALQHLDKAIELAAADPSLRQEFLQKKQRVLERAKAPGPP